jgi:hypothetical protein
MSVAEFKVLVSAAACAVETGLFASEVLSTLFIMKSLLYQQLNLKFHHPIVFSQKQFQVAALVILASAKVPAQPTVIVVAANKAINGETQECYIYVIHFRQSSCNNVSRVSSN